MNRLSLFVATLCLCIIACCAQEKKRQAFDTLAGMALGKRTARAVKYYEQPGVVVVEEVPYQAAEMLQAYLSDPEVRGALRAFESGRHASQKRTIIDRLGGDYLV